MSTQDAADIVQMNSLSSEIPVAGGDKKKKSGLLWIVLGCMVVGVGLGIYVYQQSLAPAPAPSPRASKVPASVAPVPTPTAPATNVIGPVSNTMTFPKKGKLRVFHTLNNIQAVAQLTINGTKKQITLPAKPVNNTTFMNFADSAFEVEAGSTGTLELFLNSTSGPKLLGWMDPFDPQKKECGIQGGSTANNEEQLYYATQLLAGESFFAYQCWEDDDNPGEFNDLYMIWTYAPSKASSPSPSPSASSVSSSSPSPSPSAAASKSPSPSPAASKSPSPSPSAAASKSPSPSPSASSKVSGGTSPSPSVRAAMPDTSDGVPVTGVFEVTVGTVSVGILLLVVGLLGLLTL